MGNGKIGKTFSWSLKIFRKWGKSEKFETGECIIASRGMDAPAHSINSIETVETMLQKRMTRSRRRRRKRKKRTRRRAKKKRWERGRIG